MQTDMDSERLPRPICIQNIGHKSKIWYTCSAFLVSSFHTSDWQSYLTSGILGLC